MAPNEVEILDPITDIDSLKELMDEGYVLKSQVNDPSRNLIIFERLLRRGYKLIPENWLKNNGYEFVEQSIFTKGYKLAYKMKDGVLEQYYVSNYSLIKNNNEIKLYLKYNG